jgi:GNAT superfamily N-acetyltransferase
MSDFTLREATRQDLSTMADTLTQGFETYRRWAPSAWRPPDRAAMLLGLLHRFQQDGSWGVMALDGDAPAGHVTVRPEQDDGLRDRGTRRLDVTGTHGAAGGEAPAAGEPVAGTHGVAGTQLITVARLMHLFVREPYWGSGLAGRLHGLAVEGMRARSFGSACLWTPVGQKRARAFYERRGWRATGALDPDNELALELLEYVLEL